MPLPHVLPALAVDLVSELDKANPPAIVGGPLDMVDEKRMELIYRAGRRSVVEELLRILEGEGDDASDLPPR